MGTGIGVAASLYVLDLPNAGLDISGLTETVSFDKIT